MSMDLGPILDDLAAGRIDAAEANRRIEELKRDAGGSAAPGESTESIPTSGLARVSVTAVGRRVRVEADSGIATLSVEGPHVLRRNAQVMEVSSTGEFGPSLQGFSIIRPPKNFGDLRDIGIGKELLIRVNPALVVDVELTTGSLRTTDVPRLGRVRVTGGTCHIEGATEVADLLSQAGSVTVEGPISTGRSKLKVESGSMTVVLTKGSNVMVHADSKLGRINWPGEDDKVDEVVLGNGSARLDVSVVMGMATIKTEE